MLYDVNKVDSEEAFTALRAKLTRADSVTYTCKHCNCVVTNYSLKMLYFCINILNTRLLCF